MGCCSYTGEKGFIYVLLIILIIIVIGFAIKEQFTQPKKLIYANPYEDYGYITFTNEVTPLQMYYPEPQKQIEHFVPDDESKFVQRYTRQPRTQIQNISSLNNVVPDFPAGYDYIPYDTTIRFQTPTVHVIQDRPNLANFIRA